MTDATAAAKEIVDQAIDLGDAGEHWKAYELLAKALALDPECAQAYFERGMVLMNMDRDNEAIADFDRCLELDPAFPGARDWRAKALAACGKLQAAADESLRSLREHPEGPHEGMGVNPREWAECAAAFAKIGDTKTALALLEEYLATHARNVTSYATYETAPLRELARLLMRTNDASRAAEIARGAYLNLKHRRPADVLVYALALEAAGEHREALKVADEALKINDRMKEALELKARLQDHA